MFLATTALSDFWDKRQETIFLSSSCLRYDRRDEWESINYRILPSPWDDHHRFNQAAQYLNDFYERILDHLAGYLNEVHGVSNGQRYWRILIGPWLFHFIHIVYDRYTNLVDAFAQFPNLETVLLDPGSYRTPKETMDLVRWVESDAYNLQLYSQILSALGRDFPAQPFSNGWPDPEYPRVRQDRGLLGLVRNKRRRAIKLVGEVITRILSSRQQIGLIDLNMPYAQKWLLAWQTGLRASELRLPAKWSFTLSEPTPGRDRSGLSELGPTQEFERVFAQTLTQNFPVIYLEIYHEAKAESLRKQSTIPNVLLSATGWLFNEPFKFLAAEGAERGSRLVAAQHGGAYGIRRFSAPEEHESRLSDSFLVWGWAGTKDQVLRNQPSPGLSTLRTNGLNNRRKGNSRTILFVGTAQPRYLYRFQSTPVGAQWEPYFDWQLRFLDSLSEQILCQTRFRGYHDDYDWQAQERISDRFPDLILDTGRPIAKSLHESRLIVIDNPTTTLLEAFVSNVPTVLFRDPHRWEIRDEAEQYFESLGRVGISWESPEEAAATLEAVYDDPWAWWGSKQVQDVRQEFVDRFAYARKDWVRCWAEALKREAALSRADTE